MKNLSKLMALLLSLLMILSLFAACGDDKKDDDDKEDTSVSDEKDKDDKDEDEDKEDKKDKNNKKDDEDEDEDEDDSASAEDMLIGEWVYEDEIDGVTYVVNFSFAKDGTFETSLDENSYEFVIDQALEETMADVTDEEIEEEGFTSRKEAEEYVREMLMEELSYEDIAAEFEMSGEWELDGDTLTIEIDGGGTSTAETKLSKGVTKITFINDDGKELLLEKAD